VAVEELLLYFLLAPAAAYGVAVVWLRWTMRRIAAHELGFLREPGVVPKFLVLLVYPTTPIVFGLVLLIQFQQVPEDSLTTGVVRSFGLAYATVSALTVFSQAWIVVRRGANAYRGASFARVLILTVLPETAIVWILVIGIQVVGILMRSPTEGPLSATEADGLTRAVDFFLAGSLGAPLAALLSNQPPSLEPGRFKNALLLGTIGTVIIAIGLFLALREIALL